MKIMYLLFSFTVGGTERLVSDICNEMVKRECEVYLYIVNDQYSNSMLKTIDKNVYIELYGRKRNGGRRIQTILEVTKFIRDNHIDVVHCNAFDTPELLVLHPLLFPDVRIIHTIHGIGQYESINKIKCIFRNYICDKFIAISDSVRRDIILKGADKNKTITIYNGIDLEKFKPRYKERFDKDHVKIGNIARIDLSKKGQDILIQAIDHLKRFNYKVECHFGGSADRYHTEDLKYLKKKAKELGVDENIYFWGNVDDIVTFLNDIDIFVLPSRSEGFGIALLEAMSMGIPCIASNLNGPAEIIGENKRGYLFETENAEDLARKIIGVIENYDEELKRSRMNLQYVKNNFDIKSMCNRLMDIYQSR